MSKRSATKHRAKWRRRAMVIAAPGGKIQFAEPPARRWLKQFFSRPARAGMLPRMISRWASRQAEARQRRSLVAQTKKTYLCIKREQSYTDTNFVLLLELIRGKSEE